jgi:hypothetical protein
LLEGSRDLTKGEWSRRSRDIPISVGGRAWDAGRKGRGRGRGRGGRKMRKGEDEKVQENERVERIRGRGMRKAGRGRRDAVLKERFYHFRSCIKGLVSARVMIA